jgi:hypothetical protein
MTDTYENKQAWLRTVKNAAQAGVLDDKKAVGHVEAVTLAERSALAEQKREIGRASFSMPAGYERIFKKGCIVYERPRIDPGSAPNNDR